MVSHQTDKRTGAGAEWRLRWRLAAMLVSAILRRDPRFLLFTILVCSVAATVACFQFAVFMSFLRAGAAVPRMLGGDVWIVARSVECFDFPTPFSEDYDATLARYLPEARFRRVFFGFAPWRSPTGRRANVAVVGIEGAKLAQTAFIADISDLERLDLRGGDLATIGDTTLRLHGTVDTLSTFLGAPYVITDFSSARRLLGADTTQTSFIIADMPDGLPNNFAAVRRSAALAFPDITMVPMSEFANSSSRYWQAKTGAGTAILLAAVLAALLMVILLINGIGRFIQRYEQDLLSLLGHGADGRDITIILGVVALVITLCSALIALAGAPMLTSITHPMLPWVQFALHDMLAPLAAMIAGLGCAIWMARRATERFAPDAIFRS